MTIPFQTTEEVHQYLDNNKITCLLCGRKFITLPPHLLAFHKITAEDYRFQFGIPFRYGLAGKAFRQASAERMQALISKGVIKAAQPGVLWPPRQRRRRLVSLVQNQDLEKLMRLHGKDKPFDQAVYEEFLRRVAAGRTVASVATDKDMPNTKAFFKHMQLNPDLKAAYDHARNALPIDLQVKTRRTTLQYYDKIYELRSQGLTWLQISAAMKVRPSTLRNAWRRMRLSGDLDMRAK